MTDTPQREMTLDEWVAKLPPFHRAVQELADLKERATAEAVPEPATRRDDFEEQDARYLDRLAGEIDTNESTHHWRQDVAFLQSVAAKIRRSQPTLNESPSGQGADDYHVRIIHKETRFGVEEHWCDLGKIERFLNGYYANVRPGDAIVVTVPEPVSAPTGQGSSDD